MIQIAVLGYGTVGSGVVEVINRNQESINKKAGEEINIKYVLDLRDFPGDPVQEKIVHDYEVIANDPEIKIVVEVMGGTNPAYTFVKRALESGKSVCTSNKELVAKHGVELIRIAKEKNCNFLFEASCGGGIPIIRPLNCSLTADEVDEISGILNGTTNYILSKMTSEGSEFEDVLKNAQELGYAERNPAADIEGWDACRKIAILSSLAYGHHVDFEEIYTEGITKITSADIRYAKVIHQAIPQVSSSNICISMKMMKYFTNLMVCDDGGRRRKWIGRILRMGGKNFQEDMLGHFMTPAPVKESQIPVRQLEEYFRKALLAAPKDLMELYSLALMPGSLSERWDKTYNG